MTTDTQPVGCWGALLIAASVWVGLICFVRLVLMLVHQ